MERIYIKFYLVAILLLGSGSVSGQVGSLTQVANPHSPDATALGRFVEMPVGHYTGLPDISIPLYNLEVKGMQVPISLSYHASGMKVKELPGSVGACWALNAGGVINRIVRGYPDDHTAPFASGTDIRDSDLKKRIAYAYTAGFPNIFGSVERFWMAASVSGVFYEEMSNMSNGQRLDTEYDIFSFNFNGHIGQFTFDNNNAPIQLNGNDLKIQYISRNFKITDAQGIEYYFNAVEQDYDLTAPSAPAIYTTSWYVTKIRNPLSGEEIVFTYKNYLKDVLYDQTGEGQQTFTRSYGNSLDIFRYQDASTRPLPPGVTDQCEIYNIGGRPTPPYSNNSLFPDEIIWSDKKIKFYGALNRTDLYKYKLDSIQVLSGTQVLKRIRLHTGYFNAAASRIKYRKLKLDSVRVGSELYKMKYLESVHGMGIPSIQTKGQDVWGYYNGEDENLMVGGDYSDDDFNSNVEYQTHYKVFDIPFNPYLPYFNYRNSAFRNPDAKYGQLGTLSSITYPTGGRTEFTYEGNTFGDAPTAWGSIETDPYTQLKFENQYVKQCRAQLPIASGPSNWNGTRNFVIHQDQTVQITGSVGMDQTVTYAQYQSMIYVYKPTAFIRVQKYNDATGVFDNLKLYSAKPDLLIGTPISEPDYLSKRALGRVAVSESLLLTSGRYRIYCEVSNQGVHAQLNIAAQFDYKASDSLYYAGGLRVKTIRFDPGPSSQTAFYKSYSYNDGSTSSGVLEAPIANASLSYYQSVRRFSSPTNSYYWLSCKFFNIHSEPLIPLGNSMGAPIGYAQVTETRQDGASTVYHYTTGRDGIDFHDSFMDPYASFYGMYARTRIMVDNSWKRGLVKKVEYFNEAGQPVKRQFMDYVYDVNCTAKKSISFAMDDVTLDIINFTYTAGIYGYIFRCPSKALLTRDSTVQYSPEGNTFKTVKYEYATARHYYPVKISSLNSSGDSQMEYRRYPQDFNVGIEPTDPFSKGIRKLQESNVLAPVIERYTEVRRAGQPGLSGLSGEIISFQQTLPLPDQVYQLEVTSSTLGTAYSPLTATNSSSSMDSRYKLRGQFSSYDSKGNLGQYVLQNGPTNSFLWDYSGQLMTASVQSAALNDIAFTSFEAENKGSWTYSGATVADATSPTGQRAYLLTGGNVVRTGLNSGASYVLTYWANSASAGSISGGAAAVLRANGGWTQYRRMLTGVTAVTLSGSYRVDEIRLHPIDALLTTYTYMPLVGMSSMTDPSGTTVYYEYDSFQRLIAIRDMDGKVLDNYKYQYENL